MASYTRISPRFCTAPTISGVLRIALRSGILASSIEGQHCNDVEIGRRQRGGIALINQRSLREFRRLDFPGYIDAGAQVADPLAIDIESDHRPAGTGKCDCDRQPDIAKADDGDLARMANGPVRTVSISICCTWTFLSIREQYRGPSVAATPRTSE